MTEVDLLRAVVAVLLLLTVSCTSTPGSSVSSTGWGASGGALVYLSQGDQFRSLTLSGGAADQIVVVPAGIVAGSARWSEDGTMVAYRRDQDFYVAKADGSDERLLLDPADAEVSGPVAWAPDGARLAAVAYPWSSSDLSSRVEVVDVASGSSAPVPGLGGIGDATSLDWAPDGRRLVLAGVLLAGGAGIFVGSLDGGGWVQVLEGSGHEDADWSPTSERLVFGTDGPWAPRSGNPSTPACSAHGWKVFTMNADGSDRRRLTTGKVFEWDPMWSPDGGWIAFGTDQPPNGSSRRCTRFDPSSRAVWAVRSDGSDAQLLREGNALQWQWLRSSPPAA